MKKIIFALMALTVAFAACNKTEQIEMPNDTPGDGEIEVRLSLNTSGIELATRSFLDDMAEMTEFESQINNYVVLIYDQAGNFIKMQTINPSQMNDNTHAFITIPREYAQTEVSFYVTGNFTVNNPGQGEQAILESNPSQHKLEYFNSTDPEQLLDENYFRFNFPYSGITKARLDKYGWINEVHVELSTLMNKVALELSIDPDFAANHNGSMVQINNVEFLGIPNTTYIFNPESSPSVVATGFTQKCSFNQDGKSCHLWYGYKSTERHETRLVIRGIFDKDGDFSTTGDQANITYTIPVSEFSSTGLLERGVCYRIKGVIKGLGDNNIESTFSALDWVATPEIDLPIGY